MSRAKQFIFIFLGFVSLALGIIGIFLPLLPTTPFVILSAFLFSRGSTRLHNWLLLTPQFGPALQQWERYGAISRSNKAKASALILISVLLTCVFANVPIYGKISMLVVLMSVVTFILTRPEK